MAELSISDKVTEIEKHTLVYVVDFPLSLRSLYLSVSTPLTLQYRSRTQSWLPFHQTSNPWPVNHCSLTLLWIISSSPHLLIVWKRREVD